MTEVETIARTPSPILRQHLVADLHRLGVEPGMVLLVHSSLSAIGWVPGGAIPVIRALMEALTPAGTLVMPAHSGDLSDPAEWRNPPVPEAWWPIIRAHTPAFDPALTPTRGLGRIPETFRSWPGVRRSYHPHFSFAAWGEHAGRITAHHSLDFGLGEGSPLARIYDLDGRVLLLGAGFGNNTSFHLAEYRVPNPSPQANGAPVMENGVRVWKDLRDVALEDGPFAELGSDFEQLGGVKIGRVGLAESRFFRQRPAVDFATTWLATRAN